MSILHTEDRFLGGRVVLRQQMTGFRSGLDAVMLAASVPAAAGDSALELGAGAGAVSLCLAARVAGCTITGVELDAALVELANANAAANHVEDRVHFIEGDALAQRGTFDCVFCNPPFHDGERSPDESRALALQDDGKLGDWLRAGMKRTASKGIFCTILRADRLGDALNALPHRGTSVLPLWPRRGEAARRVIVRVAKGVRAPLVFLHGLVLHESDGRYTSEAEAILRGAEPLACP